MLIEQIDTILASILEKNKNPILLVTLRKGGQELRFCGKFSSWAAEDELLWLHNDGKTPVMISSDDIISLQEVTEKELIENVNSLFRIVEAVRQSVC